MSQLGRHTILAILFVSYFSPLAHADGTVTEERLLNSVNDGNNWLVKGGNARGQHFSPLSEINETNVKDLGLAWSADIPQPDGIAMTPIVVDRVVYISAAYSMVYALNAETGKLKWSYDPDVKAAFSEVPWTSWVARANRGIAVWEGSVLVTTADCRLISLDATNGKLNWTRQTCDLKLGYGISDSPYVGGGKVFVGNAGSESGEKNRGFVSAYDAESGDLLWRFFIVPSDKDEENTTTALRMAAKTWSRDTLEKYGGGGSSWNEMTYDPESGLLFFGTGGALPYVYSIRSPSGGDNLFLSSILAVNAETGEYVWHYQTVPQDSWDYNATMNIVLADLEIDGKLRKTLMVAPKNGFHYMLDRLSGELLAADKFAKVNWATHINLETGRPVYDPQAEFWKSDDEDIVTRVWPNVWGAHSWNPMAWHPGLKLTYIPVVDVPSFINYYGGGEYSDTLEMVTEVDGKPFSPGKLVAFDPLLGKPRWAVNHDLPFNGGVMATAGNLIFQGDAKGQFSAFAADDGRLLWSIKTGSSISAAPASFAVDDEQYVLIPIGAGGGAQYVYPEMHATKESNGPTRLLAFRLGGESTPPIEAASVLRLPKQPKLDATATQIEAGKYIYVDFCVGCHGKDGVARYGGSVPDLRYSDSETHAEWHGIVLDGSRRHMGMPDQDLDIEQSEAVRAYVLSLARELRKSQ